MFSNLVTQKLANNMVATKCIYSCGEKKLRKIIICNK